ncbi:MAG: hypothetical protein GKR89_10780 [Candidatus Latescibacteria bacterium]|nr:hypothetical protein [Candidatus Latescibacterota bacterium]
MDDKLAGLIQRLEREAVEEAQRQAEEIATAARDQAEQELAAARTQAEQLVATARARAQNLEQKSALALEQAVRDAELLLKEQILLLFDRVFKEGVSQALSADFLRQLIIDLVGRWQGEGAVEVWLSEADREQLQTALLQGARAQLGGIVELKIHPHIGRGFRLGLKDQDVYYDFTDDGIAEALAELLNPGLRKILENGHG